MTENRTWRELYQAALLELRPEELGQRIAAAEKAIQQPMPDLKRNDSSSGEKLQELGDALRGLRVLATTECRVPSSTAPGLS
jgi:hypothetical protein